MKTIYLVRHGQTLFNVQKKIQGFCDSPLTEMGIGQAKLARTYLENNNIVFDEAYSSTSERAMDTLELLTEVPYTKRKNLREWNFGELEGEGEHLNPPLPYRDFFVQFKGEDEFEFQKRISDEVSDIVLGSKGDTILIVSHGAAIAQFYKKWEEHSEVRRTSRIMNCSFLKYHYDENEFVLQEIINHDFSSLEEKK